MHLFILIMIDKAVEMLSNTIFPYLDFLKDLSQLSRMFVGTSAEDHLRVSYTRYTSSDVLELLHIIIILCSKKQSGFISDES